MAADITWASLVHEALQLREWLDAHDDIDELGFAVPEYDAKLVRLDLVNQELRRMVEETRKRQGRQHVDPGAISES